MLKVVVFDSGWGGEMFADLLEERVPVVEVTRVIDWRRAPYSGRGRTEICVMTDEALQPYIGEVDVIVLASYAVTVAAMAFLQWKYPEQRFVGFELALSDYVLRRGKARNVMVLATGIVKDSMSFRREMLALKGMMVIHPECERWIQRVDDGEMSEEWIRAELGAATEVKMDAVLLYSTGFVDMKPTLERIYGRGVVVDDFARVVQKICSALHLRGGDGRRQSLQ